MRGEGGDGVGLGHVPADRDLLAAHRPLPRTLGGGPGGHVAGLGRVEVLVGEDGDVDAARPRPVALRLPHGGGPPGLLAERALQRVLAVPLHVVLRPQPVRRPPRRLPPVGPGNAEPGQTRQVQDNTQDPSQRIRVSGSKDPSQDPSQLMLVSRSESADPNQQIKARRSYSEERIQKIQVSGFESSDPSQRIRRSGSESPDPNQRI